MRTTFATAGVVAILSLVGCSRGENAGSTGSSAAATASTSAASSPAGAATFAGDSIVRGTVKAVSDSVLTLTTSSGDVRIALEPPVRVYTRKSADLSQVTDSSFVGVTSVPQPDGTQRATEIHIFPAELRGLGEGSRPMAMGGASRGTMTNGSVAGSRMTNGAARMTNGAARMTNGAARMTNGTSRGAAGGGGTITVDYAGGSQTITVPPNVPVTEIVSTSTAVPTGASVVVVANRRPDGTLRSSRVMLVGGAPAKR